MLSIARKTYFYPRSPCGERPGGYKALGFDTLISIHALLAESDSNSVLFESQICISIHALLAESDLDLHRDIAGEGLFLSTLSLRRATGWELLLLPHGLQFLSTLSLRRATQQLPHLDIRALDFYPRSPCGERRAATNTRARHWNFYPRSPCGERQNACKLNFMVHNFYPRSPCGERLLTHAGIL